MVRLVTKDDLLRHPEFAGKGISLNMHFDFKDDEEIIVIPTVSQAESVPIETIVEETVEKGEVIPMELKEPIIKVRVPKKSTPKKVATTKKKK